MNVLVLGARIIGDRNWPADLIRNFLGAAFSNEDRHVRRSREGPRDRQRSNRIMK